MNPQTILYAITIIGGAAFAIYTTYKQYQNQYENQHTYSTYDGPRRRKSRSYLCNRRSDDCIICLSTMEEQQISKLECGHIFHKSCLSTWLNQKKECPMCRAKALYA